MNRKGEHEILTITHSYSTVHTMYNIIYRLGLVKILRTKVCIHIHIKFHSIVLWEDFYIILFHFCSSYLLYIYYFGVEVDTFSLSINIYSDRVGEHEILTIMYSYSALSTYNVQYISQTYFQYTQLDT